MATTFAGLSPSDASAPGARYVATWRFRASAYFPASWFAAVDVAAKVQEALPAVGFIPVTRPTAVDGDEVIVFAVRQGTAANASTVADVARELGRLPGLSTPLVLDRLAPVQLSGTTTGEVDKQVDKARNLGNDAAAADGLLNKAGDVVNDAAKAAGDALRELLKPLAVPLIIAGVLAALYFAAKAKGTRTL